VPRAARTTVAIAVVVLTLVFAAVAGAAAVKGQTAAGIALARATLLARADFGSGWSAGPKPASVSPLTCPAFHPSLSGVTEIGAASSRTFQAGSSGPFVSQTSYVYRNASQAATVAAAVIAPGMLRCVAAALVSGSSRGVTFAVSSRRRFSVQGTAATAAGYRVSGTAARSDQTVGAYLDMIVLARGQTVSQISFASLLTPPDPKLEVRLARIIARRIGAA
jgi:hypothetical protein